MNSNKALLKNLSDKLTEYDELLDKLKSQVDKIECSFKLELRQQILNLESKKIFLESRIGQLDKSVTSPSHSSGDGIANAIDDLDTAFNKISFRIDKLIHKH